MDRIHLAGGFCEDGAYKKRYFISTQETIDSPKKRNLLHEVGELEK